MKIMKANQAHGAPTIKVALIGPSGSGKTSWMCRAPYPLMIMFERQGIEKVRAIAPETPVVFCESYREFDEIWNELKMAPTHPTIPGAIILDMGDEQIPVATVCIDSMTELGSSMVQQMQKSAGGANWSPTELDQKRASLTMNNWGTIGETLVEVMRNVAKFPTSVICSFLPDVVHDVAGNAHYKPNLPGKFATSKATAFFSAVGFTRRRKGDEGPEHWIVWTHPSERYPVKGMFGWPAQIRNTMEPGRTTLGSLMLKTYPDGSAISAPGDDAKWCEEIDTAFDDNVTYTEPIPQRPVDEPVAEQAQSPTRNEQRPPAGVVAAPRR